MTKQSCSHCGGTDIVRNIHLGMPTEASRIGLDYQTAFILTGTEPLLADLCRSCGTVVRMHVKEADRDWNTA